jgi:dihydropteroate synthase
MASYDDVVSDVATELSRRIDVAIAHRIDPQRIVLDPGLGFAKEADDNWELLRGIETLKLLGRPLLIGASRKRFLGQLLAEADGTPRAVFARDAATDAISAIAAVHGAWAVRVHNVRASADAVRVAQAWSGRG